MIYLSSTLPGTRPGSLYARFSKFPISGWAAPRARGPDSRFPISSPVSLRIRPSGRDETRSHRDIPLRIIVFALCAHTHVQTGHHVSKRTGPSVNVSCFVSPITACGARAGRRGPRFRPPVPAGEGWRGNGSGPAETRETQSGPETVAGVSFDRLGRPHRCFDRKAAMVAVTARAERFDQMSISRGIST